MVPTNPTHILIATSNPGKLRDFAGAAQAHGVTVEGMPGFADLPEAVEDGATFEENARKKAEYYSRFAPGQLVLADDSGLSVPALGGQPGVHSARYALAVNGASDDVPASGGALQTRDRAAIDRANNAKLLREMHILDGPERAACFVCVISAARDGREVVHFRGEAEGTILAEARGGMGFGYDPLFYLPALDKSYAELTPEEKAKVSHRGAALRAFIAWALEASR